MRQKEYSLSLTASLSYSLCPPPPTLSFSVFNFLFCSPKSLKWGQTTFLSQVLIRNCRPWKNYVSVYSYHSPSLKFAPSALSPSMHFSLTLFFFSTLLLFCLNVAFSLPMHILQLSVLSLKSVISFWSVIIKKKMSWCVRKMLLYCFISVQWVRTLVCLNDKSSIQRANCQCALLIDVS